MSCSPLGTGERLGELHHDAIAIAQHREVRDGPELFAQRPVEFRNAMPQRGDPQRWDGVQVATTIDIDKFTPFSSLDNHTGALAA